jgi:tetratricopeptide (TPR) repeat protein
MAAIDPTVDALSERLRNHPGDLRAYEQLKAAYRRQGDFASLVNLIAGWCSWTADARAASRGYQEVAEVLEQQLGDPEQAERFYREAIARDALNFDASEALQALWERGGNYHALTEFLQEHLQTLSHAGAESRQLAILRYRLGELWSKQFNSPDAALHHYKKAIELDPTLSRAMYEARQLHAALGDLRACADLYEREVTSEHDGARKLMLLRELAELYSRELADVDGAIGALSRARKLDPADDALSHQLATLLAQRAAGLDERIAHEDYSQVADLLCDIASHVPGAERLPYLRSAHGYAPWHARTLDSIEGLALDPGALAQYWVGYVAAASDGPHVHARRVALARAYAASGQVEDALFCLEPALRAGDREARALDEELRGSGDEAHTRASDDPRLYEQNLEAARAEREREREREPEPEPEPIVSAQPAARPLRPTLRRGVPASVAAQLEALARPAPSQPTEADDLPELEPDEDEDGAWEDEYKTELGDDALIEELRARTAKSEILAPTPSELPPPASQPPRRLELEAVPELQPESEPAPEQDLAALAHHAKTLVAQQQNDEAAQAYLELLEADPLHRDAFNFLDGYYRRTRDHALRSQLLVRTASVEGLPLSTRVNRLKEAATTYETRLRDTDGAVDAWRMLERLTPDSAEVGKAIKRLLEKAQRWDDLAASLQRDADAASDPAQRLTVLERLAKLHRDERGDLEAACEVGRQLHALAPKHDAHADQLCDDLLTLQRYDEAVPLLRERIARTEQKSRRLPLLRSLASVLDAQLHDTDAAYLAYLQLLELAPGDQAALSRMEQLDDEAGNYARLLETLELQARHTSPAAVAQLYVRMGTIAEADLLDRERAAQYLARAVDAAPTDAAILNALCNLFERDERFVDLVELLRERAVQEKNQAARADLYRRIALLLSERLDDAAGAAEAWQARLALGDDLEGLRFMQQHWLRRDAPAELADVQGRLAALEPDPGEKRDLLYERAILLARRLGKPREAIVELERILLEIDPFFEPALDSLEEASREAKQYDALARVLESQLGRADSGADVVLLCRKLADLYEGKLASPERAIPALSRWAETDPEDVEPQRRLRPLFDAKRMHKELLECLDALAALLDVPEERHEAAIAAATLAYQKLRDVDGAWARLAPLAEDGVKDAITTLKALARKVDRLDDLCDVLESGTQYETLLALLRERVATEKEQEPRLVLLHRMARLLLGPLGDEAGAAVVYQNILALREDAIALRFLHGKALREDDPNALVDCLARLAALERDPAEKRDLLYEQARLLRGRLARPKDAIAVLATLVAGHPDDEAAVDELLVACEDAGDYATLARTLEAQLAVEREPETRAALACRLSELYETRLDDPRRAVGALEKWVAASPEDPEPLRRLRPHLERTRRYPPLLETLDALSRTEASPEARADAAIDAAELAHRHLKDPEGAWSRLAPLVPLAAPRADAALLALARDTERLEQLYTLYESARRYPALVARLRERVAEETNPASRMRLLRRIAKTHAERLDDEAAAEACFRELLALGEDAEALRFLQSRAIRGGDTEALVDCLRRLAQLEEDAAERKDLLFELGHALNQLDRPAEAITVLEELLDKLDPQFVPALDELLGACEKHGDPASLARTLERMLAIEKDPTSFVELASRLADLYESEPPNLEAAVRVLRAWSDTEPGNPEPHRRLWPHLERMGRSSELLVHLDALGRSSDDGREAARALGLAARIAFDELRDVDGAWRRAEPLMRAGHAEAEQLLRRMAFATQRLDPLCQLYESLERYDDLVLLLREQAEAESDRERRAELFRRCARVLAQLGDEMAAGEAWREVLAIEEDQEGLSFMRSIAQRHDDVVELAEILGRLANLLRDPVEKRDVLFERALLLADRLDRAAEAVSVLQYVVRELDPAFTPALEELVTHCESLQDHAGLAEALERQLAMTESPQQRGDVAQRLADLYANELRSPERAAAALGHWAEVAPNDPEPHRRLRPLLEDQGDAQALLRVLDALARSENRDEARKEAAITASKLAWKKLEDAPGAWRRLAPLVHVGDADAEKLAHELARAAKLEASLAALYVARAQQARDPVRAGEDWGRAAQVYEDYLGKIDEALEAALRRFAADTADARALADVERLAIRARAFPRLRQVYKHLVSSAASPTKQAELMLRLAKILDEQAGDAAGALEQVLAACKVAPESDAALEQAEALALKAESSAELLWIYEQRYESADDDEARGRYLLSAARISDLALGDREQANLHLRRALTLTESVPHLAIQIEELARELDDKRRELGRDDVRRTLIQAHLELAQSHGEPFGPVLVLRASQLLHDELQDRSATFDVLRRGSTMFPDDPDIADGLEQAAVEIRRLDALDAHLARLASEVTDDDTRIGLLERRGRVLSDHLKRHDSAASVYREILQIDPDDEGAARALMNCLKKAGRFQQLIRAINERIERSDEPDERIALMREVAAVWEVELKNRTGAIEVWSELIALRPGDEEAAQALARLQQ